MLAYLSFQEKLYSANLTKGIDISIPLKEGLDSVNCFYAPYFEAVPVVMGSFVGSTEKGGAVNFKTVKFNPHGNGTHTECVGHISSLPITIHQALKQFHFTTLLVSVFPEKMDNGDRVLTLARLQAACTATLPKAIVIRTLPNDNHKLKTVYSGANPPYFEAAALTWLVEQGIEHILTDLPSVDREEDGGKLAGHKAFWTHPENTSLERTITELVFVSNEVMDGLYLLNLQVASMELDASPSKPVLYPLTEASSNVVMDELH